MLTQLHEISRRLGALRMLTLACILGRKALGLRSRMPSTAACRVVSCSWLLQQLTQLQLSQYRPDAKHSQYLRAGRQGLKICLL